MVCGGAELGYGELDARSNQLARRLIGLGIGPETVVGLALERSVELVVAVLAVLKAGGCYLPLDAGHPPARLAFLLADAGAALVLTTAALAGHLPPEVPALRLDDDGAAAVLGAARRRRAPRRARPRPSRLHHLHLGIHRRPQGRRWCSHRGMVNLAAGAYPRLRCSAPATALLQYASPSFDVSVGSCGSALLSGATLVHGAGRAAGTASRATRPR